MIAARIKTDEQRVYLLLEVMRQDRISAPAKVGQLQEELMAHHETDSFKNCRSMGELVEQNIELLLAKAFRQSMR